MVIFDIFFIVIIGGAVVLVLAWLLAGQIVRRRKPDPRSVPDVPFAFEVFTARDGVELDGRYSGQRDGRPTVILAPGQFGSMDGDTPFVRVLVNAGFDVFQFDWRAHGNSDGRHTTLGVDEIHDLIGAVDLVQSRGVRHIGVVGFSMGASVALRAAARDPRIACVVADGPFIAVAHSLEGWVKGRIGLKLRPFVWLVLRFTELRLGNIDLDEASPLPHVADISPRPVMFIHGQADPLVPLADQEALYAACGSPKTLWQVEGAGHRDAMDHPAYNQRVITFLQGGLHGVQHRRKNRKGQKSASRP